VLPPYDPQRVLKLHFRSWLTWRGGILSGFPRWRVGLVWVCSRIQARRASEGNKPEARGEGEHLKSATSNYVACPRLRFGLGGRLSILRVRCLRKNTAELFGLGCDWWMVWQSGCCCGGGSDGAGGPGAPGGEAGDDDPQEDVVPNRRGEIRVAKHEWRDDQPDTDHNVDPA